MHTECGSNRIFMELKWVNSPSGSLLISRSNRTFMELKYLKILIMMNFGKF